MSRRQEAGNGTGVRVRDDDRRSGGRSGGAGRHHEAGPVGSGAVGGPTAARRWPTSVIGFGPRKVHRGTVDPIAHPQLPARSSLFVGANPTPAAAAVAASLIASGFGIAFLTLQTSLAASLVTGRSGPSPLPHPALLWWLGLVAGGALLVAGGSRLVGVVGSRRSARTPLGRALATMPVDWAVVEGVVPHDGRPVGRIVIGSFGVAVLHELRGTEQLRRIDDGWVEWSPTGWIPAEHPVDHAARDAERVRHWLTHGDLDFVVRVHGALVTTDPRIPRSPVCAVVQPDEVPRWLAGLQPQRSLTAGRRQRLIARAREAAAHRAH
jgi:hypothetical protein